jgi:predicted MFS family arabinose efflux permease
VLLLGCIPAAIGYIMTALAGSVEAFVLWRAITAIGYAFITIACQGYLAESSDGNNRARAMAVFVSAVMTGAVCGTAIGAVLAERVGFRYTFAMSAVITCMVGVLAQHSMEANAGRRMVARAALPNPRRAGKSVLVEAMSNPRFAGLVLLAAIPAKVVLSSFVFYLTPLYLSSLDLSQPAIGRNVVLYGLTMLLTIPLGAIASDRLRATGGMIVLAGVATGLGMLAPRFFGPDVAIPIAIALTGLCQGLASAPMLALVPEICPRETARHGIAALLGYLRLGERLGSIAGPLLAASLVAMVGYVDAISLIGVLSLITALLYALVVGLPNDPPENRQQAA